MIKNILNDYKNELIADDLFTQALQSLQNGEYDKCKALCILTLSISQNIEQRLALQLILQLSLKKNKEEINKILNVAYNY